MSISQLTIVNGALVAIGADPIISIDENTNEARTAKSRFDTVRDAVLRAAPWGCAISRAELAQTSEDPLFGYAYRYALPANPYCLRVLTMDEADLGYLWRVAGRFLETDSETANIEFIRRLTSYSEYDPQLAETISARLAAEIAYKITANKTMTESMWDLYKLKLGEAMGLNAIEGAEEAPAESGWIDIRS